VDWLAARSNPFLFWSLRPGALRIEGRSRGCKKHAFRSLNREGALYWSDTIFEVNDIQYTLFAPLASLRANPKHDADGFSFSHCRAFALDDPGEGQSEANAQASFELAIAAFHSPIQVSH